MGELHGDEMRREYDGDVKVFAVEDGGGTYWYAAKGAVDALRDHVETCGNDEAVQNPEEGVTVTLCDPANMLAFVEQEDAEQWPAYWDHTPTAAGSDRIAATCAEWAAFHADKAPQQLGSTEF